jgi:kelch-like protein 20
MAIFAGGFNKINNNNTTVNLKTVDIYNANTGVWTTSQLSQARRYLAAAAAGNKIIFAGGTPDNGYSKVVDIFELK